MKHAVVRYYFDADILGLGRIVARLRPDATFPGDPGAVINKRSRPACVIQSTDIDDIDWIPVVATQGMIAISRDGRIAWHAAERAAIMNSGARLLVLNSREAVTVWSQLEILMCQWRTIERLTGEPGPYIRRVTRSGIRDIGG